jgi:hypothetical protein
LTSELIEWDPQASHYEEEEASMLDDKGHLQGANDEARRTIAAIHTIEQEQPDEYLLDALLENTVHVQTTVSAREKHNIVITTSKQARTIGAKTLAKNWCIGLKQAELTIEGVCGQQCIQHY